MTITSYSNTDYRSVADYESYDLLQDYSGYDNVIEYYIQGVAENYYPEYVNNILDFSSEEKKYIRFAMGDFSRLTGAQFVETNDFDSAVINLIKIDSFENEDIILTYEQAAAKNSFENDEIFKIYLKMSFNFNQLVNAQEIYKNLPYRSVKHSGYFQVYEQVFKNFIDKKFPD